VDEENEDASSKRLRNIAHIPFEGRFYMISGKSIICFSSNDWTDIPSSKFHIMKHVGRSNLVLYVETIGLRHPQFLSRDVRRALTKLRKTCRWVKNVENGIFTWSPPAIPYHGLAIVEWLNALILSIMIRRIARRLAMKDPIIWSYMPNAIEIIERIPSSKVIYHCIDDYAEFTDVPKAAFEKMERKMLERADITIVSAKKLYENKRPYARNIIYIPHGVNLTEFQGYLKETLNIKDIDGIKSPIAGFIGRIADWVDLPLIMRCARELPNWNFVLVGPSNVDLKPYLGIPNVHFLGKKDYKDIPHYIQRFDVCLMPFVCNALVASVNPLKMYEYLALGKPVVTVPMDEVEDFAHLLTIAGPSNFSKGIEKAYEEDTEVKRVMRIESVSGRSWGDVAEKILGLVG